MAHFEGELLIPRLLARLNPYRSDEPLPPMVSTMVIVLEPGERPAMVDRWLNCDLGSIGVQVFLGWGDDGPYVQHARCGLRVPDLPMINIPPDLIRFKLLRPAAPGSVPERTDDGPTEPAGRPL